jgi:predicted nucleic acid-binding protein
VIVLDTTVLVYAVGDEHPIREPSRRVIESVSEGRLHATTTPEVIHEFAHVRARRRGRRDAVGLARDYALLLAPLLTTEAAHVPQALVLFERHERLGAFDALLAATALAAEAEALVSADSAFGTVSRLPLVRLGTAELDALIAR